ncbi:lipopolysaccharide transport system ATP-binding protein [Pustulibacterium marinum]|uniref:Lipopolysaccharide transport system ATP-binding protein n=1 Tax=Pustulibacterium marinum TaxID=1224947 RepID=A0A1I7HMI6_9FLAO|nr:ABC transporter ATP-binding protein [Pustulibacterium marinum]SFU61851.1 lipopolysaccharide transport system ATP-binding protein [Pustulibacterium marinum]
MSVILKAENISKQYRLGVVGTGTLSHDLNRWWHTVRGKEDPYLKIGESNDRSSKGNSDYVWALRDINFEVQKGEVLGIIGKNGAGKSTLLKILSRVTTPTTGSIKTAGRIASLLEVGTGFHPELTGRENIYLNGTILGMTKAEVAFKLDEIIAFSGCERYVDTPVKRYSSGMKVRLAFAVAAHLEPEILVVDEVLAVGDAEFQKKAIGKMQDISKGEGRTVLFVSHNMESIQQLCTRCVVMANGGLQYEGDVQSAIEQYLDIYGSGTLELSFPIKGKGICLNDFKILSKENILSSSIANLVLGNAYQFSLQLTSLEFDKLLNIRFQIFDKRNSLVTTLNTYHMNANFSVQPDVKMTVLCEIEKLSIAPGDYVLGIEILDLHDKKVLYSNETFYPFSVVNGDFYGFGKLPSAKNMGAFSMDFNWKVIS